METVLVTGGAGFIGSNLVVQLQKKYSVVVIDNFSTGKKENLPNSPLIELIEVDICDREKMNEVFNKYQFKYIFHLAAVASVQKSLDDTLKTHQVNAEATINILELVHKTQNHLKKIIFSSTAAVYGNEKNVPKFENSTIELLSPYAIDKYTSELYFSHYSATYKIPYTILRFFNVYGSGQNPESSYSGVISILMNQLLKGSSKSFTIFGDGEQVRDFIYIDDVVDALQFIMNNPLAHNEIFNTCTNRGTSLNELIIACQSIIGERIKIIKKPEKISDIRTSIGNNKKLIDIGFKFSNTLHEGLSKYIENEKEKNGIYL